jgi:hypothetical protein
LRPTALPVPPTAVLDAAYATDQREVFTVATQILEGAITLGKKPDPIHSWLRVPQ